jgi:hypothetical protein
VYRGILGATETVSGAIALAPFDYVLGKAFIKEMQSLASGSCQ